MNYIAETGNHPEKQTLLDFLSGSLSQEETDAVTEHLASCISCSNALAELASQHPRETPAGFEEEVRRRIDREKEKKSELLHFSFRVAIAACAAFFFIFLGALNAAAGPQNPLAKIEAPSFSAVDNISTQLRDFSQKILQMEVFQDAKTKK